MPLINLSQLSLSSESVGIDIGSFSVKAVQIKQKRLSRERYISFGISEIKQDKTHAAVVRAIKEAASEAKLESNKVHLSVCGPDTIMRYITLPCLELKELSHCLDFELERYIPGKKKEGIIIDYKILYKLPNNQMMVLLIALDRKIIEERTNFAKEAGFAPVAVTIDCLALMDAYKAVPFYGKDKGVIAILDIGHLVSKLVVFQGDTLYFSRDINNGVFDLVRLTCERANFDYNLIDELGPELEVKAKDVYLGVKANLNGLVDELRLSFEYCWRHLQQKIGQLYLCGGGSRIKLIEETLAKDLNLKTNSLDVTQTFKASSDAQQVKFKEYWPLMPVAFGLAAG